MEEKDLLKNQQTLHSAYKRVFGTPEGKIVLHNILSRCHMLDSSADPNPYNTYFKEGRRAIALEIMNILRFDIYKVKEQIEEINNARSYS